MPLNDPVIRATLKQHLLKLRAKPRAIIDELHVHKGNAIADVVAIYKEPHCFEIKGETDNVKRIIRQGKFFNLSFKKITLITTKNHLANALKTAPDFWGVMIAYEKDGDIKLKYYRKAENNPCFDKEIALYTLWRQEMLDLSNIKKIELSKRINKQSIANEIANHLSGKEVSSSIANFLLERNVT
ncbi:sce7726 family protein [Aestuariicella hydrocarbonica]|uniref:Sce7726 family protein n=1 Tax=Pseudomaricurvus hydrocarbonicus TaxID=1470433 RepID=A0A9E5MQ27_9GAMM|nr:sce7726 family protein [Aestuariicella hydrocarbonica]NHO68409.1 sce7726 family protein [Aestuariicella hydrocarbonica]